MKLCCSEAVRWKEKAIGKSRKQRRNQRQETKTKTLKGMSRCHVFRNWAIGLIYYGRTVNSSILLVCYSEAERKEEAKKRLEKRLENLASIELLSEVRS